MTGCMVTYSFYEGDTRVMRYAEALAARGDQVDVIALRRDGQSKKEVVHGVNVYRIQQRSPNDSARSSYLVGILMFCWRAMCLLIRRHVRVRYQLIHVHSVPDFLVFATWFSKLTGTKIVLDIHDLLPEFYASKYGTSHNSMAVRVLRLIERASASFSDHVIAANDLWREKLVSRSVKSERCSSMVNVPDQALFARQGRTRTDQRFVVLYPGTLNWHQGLDIAIRAFALIKDEAPEAQFHIYGEGPCRSSLVQLTRELRLQDRVFIKSFISTRQIASVIENADLGIVPKRKEGFGNEAFSTKIMEFMAMGVPVIVSDTRVDRYYFDDSVVKFFSGGDEQDLARAMLLLIKNPGICNALAVEGTKFVEHNNWDIMKKEYLTLVDSLVGEFRIPEPART
jgi:glycosyltransferase involved in cell wall biosynthesis